MGKNKAVPIEKPDPMEGNEDGIPSDFNENKPIPPIQIMRTGLAIMNNEMGRLVRKSRETGLNGMQAMMLKEFVRTCSDIHKKHKDLNMDWLSYGDLETITDERLNEMMLSAAKALKIDLGNVNETIGVRPRDQKKVIDYES